jgi:hypothetical protein
VRHHAASLRVIRTTGKAKAVKPRFTAFAVKRLPPATAL